MLNAQGLDDVQNWLVSPEGQIGVSALLILGGLLFVYFLPTVIAGFRQQNFLAVFVVNFVLGWTLVGWFAALVMSIWQRGEVVVHNTVQLVDGKSQRAQIGRVSTMLEELDKLHSLLQKGVLSEVEYEEAKKKLLK